DYELVIKIDDAITYDSDEINLSAYVKDNKNLTLDIYVKFIESLSVTS
ncbi:TPA_asm: negative regulator GrlR, partial [Salmonella enterica subsp. salamae serovar 58:l,z13,z28:z6]|nr:negative regulator GrlR [Salmonella enterica subsp. salamae serovar 58:l,z13,z28:z6]